MGEQKGEDGVKKQRQRLARYLFVFCPIRQEEESRRQEKNAGKICWEEEFRDAAEETQAYREEEEGEKAESTIICELLPLPVSAGFQPSVKAPKPGIRWKKYRPVMVAEDSFSECVSVPKKTLYLERNCSSQAGRPGLLAHRLLEP